VIGDTREARRTCAVLTSLGHDVRHLEAPTDHRLAAVLTPDVASLNVLLHSDTSVLRYCLAAEQLRPGLQMYVAVFDRTISSHLTRTVPNCQVLSPADVAVPYLVAACLDDRAAAIVRTGPRTWESRVRGEDSGPDFAVSARVRAVGVVGRVLGQLRSHDSGSRILLTGLFGLLALLVLDTSLGVTVLHETWIGSLHAAVRTVATVGPVLLEPDTGWYALFSSVAMLLAIGFTAMFTAGIVEHLLSGRFVGLAGRRVLPRRGHVVVVGMGQVGIRLAQELRDMGVAVVGVDRDPRTVNLPSARSHNIPVHVGDAGRLRVLRRLRVDRAIALCAVASDELDNVAVAAAARSLAPGLRIVIRAGNHNAIVETQSLRSLGTTCDVTGLTIDYLMASLLRTVPLVEAGDDAGEPAAANRVSVDHGCWH
jgi:hypothetical protein